MFAKIISILFFCMTSLMSFAQNANKKMTQPIHGSLMKFTMKKQSIILRE
jgi:hypothetical protein